MPNVDIRQGVLYVVGLAIYSSIIFGPLNIYWYSASIDATVVIMGRGLADDESTRQGIHRPHG